MKGTRPLDNDEIRRVSACFTGTYEIRNRGLFMIGVSTGGRISELLSLRVGDVYQNGKPVTDLLYTKRIVKGGEVSRSVPVNADGRKAIGEVVNWHRSITETLSPQNDRYSLRVITPALWHCTAKPRTRYSRRLSSRRDSTDTSRRIHCGSRLPSGCMTRPATSIWCKRSSVTGTSPQPKST